MVCATGTEGKNKLFDSTEDLHAEETRIAHTQFERLISRDLLSIPQYTGRRNSVFTQAPTPWCILSKK